MKNNPMHNRRPMHLSPRCGARTRQHTPCRSPAMANGRCRMHGGASPGAPKGNANAYKHGRYTAEAIAQRRETRDLIRSLRELVRDRTEMEHLIAVHGVDCTRH